MRTLTICCCLAVLAACSKPEQKAAEGMGAGAPISLAGVAGTWTVNVTPATSDSVLLTFNLIATADPSGWKFDFPGREPVAVRVLETAGDSIVTEAGPYESMFRKGIMVSTHSVMRLQDGNLVGTTIAHYATTTPDSVLTLRTRGTRAP
jgi:hypothetical protein